MNATPLYPLTFQPVYQSYLWGGQRIAEIFNRPDTPPVCAESWEISDRPEGLSRALNGPWQGRSLTDLIGAHPLEILGPHSASLRFPLLIKLIDAAQKLSLQVHPNDVSAETVGGEPKSEMWIVLSATPDAYVYAGFKKPLTVDQFRNALTARKLPDLLHRVSVRPGDALFIPGGRVHAIGEGCLLLEIQQNSNTTFRVHDWDRVGPDGRPRALHLDQALKVIDWNDTESGLIRLPPLKTIQPTLLFECPWFRAEKLGIQAATELTRHPDGFQILFVETGSLILGEGDDETPAARGSSWLIPAGMDRLHLRAGSATGEAHILQITVPRAR
jgi:mannose-6-phosphate isomerase